MKNVNILYKYKMQTIKVNLLQTPLLSSECSYCKTEITQDEIIPCEACLKHYHSACINSAYEKKLTRWNIPLWFSQYDYTCTGCKTPFRTITKESYLQSLTPENTSICALFFLTFLQIFLSFFVGIPLDLIVGHNGYFVHFEDYFSVYIVNGLILTSIILACLYSIFTREIFYNSLKNNKNFYTMFLVLFPVYLAFPMHYEFLYKLSVRKQNSDKYIVSYDYTLPGSEIIV